MLSDGWSLYKVVRRKHNTKSRATERHISHTHLVPSFVSHFQIFRVASRCPTTRNNKLNVSQPRMGCQSFPSIPKYHMMINNMYQQQPLRHRTPRGSTPLRRPHPSDVRLPNPSKAKPPSQHLIPTPQLLPHQTRLNNPIPHPRIHQAPPRRRSPCPSIPIPTLTSTLTHSPPKANKITSGYAIPALSALYILFTFGFSGAASAAGQAMGRAEGFDNDHPRKHVGKLDGLPLRLRSAHYALMENFAGTLHFILVFIILSSLPFCFVFCLTRIRRFRTRRRPSTSPRPDGRAGREFTGFPCPGEGGCALSGLFGECGAAEDVGAFECYGGVGECLLEVGCAGGLSGGRLC